MPYWKTVCQIVKCDLIREFGHQKCSHFVKDSCYICIQIRFLQNKHVRKNIYATIYHKGNFLFA